ncbi:MAG: ATP-binding protein [Desulfobacterales bacterium]
MPAEYMSQIFDPFFTTKKEGMGTGLGLSVSYNIIKKNGGRMEVQSQPGQGTCFSIFLPLSGRLNV